MAWIKLAQLSEVPERGMIMTVEQSTPWATDTETYAVKVEGGEVHVDL